jgi:hypothetical protein
MNMTRVDLMLVDIYIYSTLIFFPVKHMKTGIKNTLKYNIIANDF